MKNLFLMCAMSLSVLLAPQASVADNGRLRAFIGLWEAVDPSDGSLTQRSISCDRDGMCSILGSDSFWVVCGSPRGILRGEGILEDDGLRVPDFTLTCTEAGFDLTVDTLFVLDRSNRTLLEKHLDAPIPTIEFHRKSW